MKRLFNGGWSFWCGEPDLDVSEAGKHLTEFQKVDLPHDWLIADAKNLYRDGCGFYRKIFSMQPKENKRYSLIFEGVYMDTTIWVNEQQAGEWKYGYSTFEIDLTPFVKAGENEILVSVNFRSPNSRWYSGAGIYRDVWFKETPETYIRENGVYIHTEACGEKVGKEPDFLLYADTEIVGDAWDEVRHTLYAKREAQPEIELPFELLLGDEMELVEEASPEETYAGSERADFCVSETIIFHNTNKNTNIYRVKSPRRWDVEHPHLYILKTELWKDGEIIQEEYSQIGFRSIAFDPEQGFLLNGRKVKLNGVCEHHDLGALGAAFHRAAMARKFRILKEMGVKIPIAFGESMRIYYEYETYIEKGVDHVQPSVGRMTRMDDLIRIRDLAREKGVKFTSGGRIYLNAIFGCLYNEDEWIEYHEPISRPVGAYTLFQPEEKNGRFYCQPDLPGNPQRLDIAKLEKDGLMESREIYYPKNW